MRQLRAGKTIKNGRKTTKNETQSETNTSGDSFKAKQEITQWGPKTTGNKHRKTRAQKKTT